MHTYSLPHLFWRIIGHAVGKLVEASQNEMPCLTYIQNLFCDERCVKKCGICNKPKTRLKSAVTYHVVEPVSKSKDFLAEWIHHKYPENKVYSCVYVASCIVLGHPVYQH